MKARLLNKRATIKYYYDYCFRALIRQMDNKFEICYSTWWMPYELRPDNDVRITEKLAKELKPDVFQ
jgi:hypothetical protein